MRATVALLVAASIAALVSAPPARAEGKTLLGLVSISANEANNQRFIAGASKAAAGLGWDVSVIDAAGSADQANAAIQNLVQRRAGAIVEMVFPVSSLGAGLRAAQAAGIPVASWGGGMGRGIAATNGSGGPMAKPIVERLVADLGAHGSVLELTYHTGEVCRQREAVADAVLAAAPGLKVTKNEVRIPGYFQDGAQYATAWLAAHPDGAEKLAIWGCWDDPAVGAISALRQQRRTDVMVYGVNGNAQAVDAISHGRMAATAWQDSATEGERLVAALDAARKAGASWQPQAVEVPAVVVTRADVDGFLKQHPDAAPTN